MTDNILYHMPPQQQQGYKPSSNQPPRGYEQQYQNPKYYQGNDWKTMNDAQGDQQQSDKSSNLNYLQKEFLKNEYERQQGENQRKKDDFLTQKQTDLYLQQQLKKEYDNDVLREKQQQADKKRAMAEMYKAQIEQTQRDKALKKQQQIEEDRVRLNMQYEDGRKEDKARGIKEDLRRDMVGQQLQSEQRIKQELYRYQDQNVQPQFEIGGENIQKRQQMEKYERIQQVNARNFISYDDEKKRKADTFSNQGAPSTYGGQNRQYANNNNNKQMEDQYYEKINEKREYNEQLKRQMAENDQRKIQEKHDRLRGYEFDQVSNQNKGQYSQQQISQQPSKQGLQQQEYDIMGNQRNPYAQQKGSSDNQKKEDQQRYRQMLDMQAEQNKIAKMKEEQAYYQPSQPQQYSNNPTNPARGKAQTEQEYDIMGNQRVAYTGAAQGNSQKDQKKDDQLRYREMLDVQREQTKLQKLKEEDDMYDMERKYNGLNIGRQPLEHQKKVYNPITNSYPYKQQERDDYKYQQQQYGRELNSGKGSQQRIDYSSLAKQNILQQNY